MADVLGELLLQSLRLGDVIGKLLAHAIDETGLGGPKAWAVVHPVENNPEVDGAAWAAGATRCQLCWIRGACVGWVAHG